MPRVYASLCFLVVIGSGMVSAQVDYPARAETLEIHLRYRIRSGPDDRIREYRALTALLEKNGFVPMPREDADLDIFDPTAELLHGTIPSANVQQVFQDPRVQTVVAIPTGYALPAEESAMLPLRINLADGFGPTEQRRFHEQVASHLALLQFQESVGYDHRGYRVLRGALPTKHLLTLLKDLRYQPSGWFAPAIAFDQLPSPFQMTLPIRYVEVLPALPADATPPAAPDAPAPAPAPEGVPPMGTAPNPFQSKLTTEVMNYLSDPMVLDQPLRVEVILQEFNPRTWDSVRFQLRSSATGLAVEGQVGVVVTVQLLKAGDLHKILPLPEVRSVRLVRTGAETAHGVLSANEVVKVKDLLASSHLERLHMLGYQGEGQRIVIVGTEFPAIEQMRGKQLGGSTAYIDLTAELDRTLTPAPPSGRAGIGTIAAMTAQAAAPKAHLTLVRIHPSAFHQLLNVARLVIGDARYSESMQARSLELVRDAELLRIRRTLTTEEYRQAFMNLSDEERQTRRREAARAALEKLMQDEETFKGVAQRFAALKEAVDSLKGASVVVNTLVWDAGYPQDGLSELDAYINEKFTPKAARSALEALKRPPAPVWVQAASTAVGQVWAGSYLDADGNGVMEFAGDATAIPSQRWTRELNFLTLRTAKGDNAMSLPQGAKLRFTVQWREPHDPDGFLPREPIFPFSLRLLRQLDPKGETVASDELVEVGHSTGEPVRLLKTTGSGAYEQTLEVTIPADGVYALRVEGSSAFEYQLPALRQGFEVFPRIVVEALDAATQAKGHVVFRTYEAKNVGVGVPGGAYSAITMGVLGEKQQTLTGAGPGVTLLAKPDLRTAGTIDVDGYGATGSAVAAGFAGGFSAGLLSAGMRPKELLKSEALEPGGELLVPSSWLSYIRPRVQN